MLQPKIFTFKEAEEILKPQHIAKAILNLKKKGWSETRRARDWHLLAEGRKFPPKVVIEEEIAVAIGKQVDASNFDQGGEKTTNELLRKLGFPIVKGKSD